MNDSGSSSGGTSFLTLLAIVFITMKLLGKIDWSWWWVLSPLWGSALMGLLCLFVYTLIERRKRTR